MIIVISCFFFKGPENILSAKRVEKQEVKNKCLLTFQNYYMYFFLTHAEAGVHIRLHVLEAGNVTDRFSGSV